MTILLNLKVIPRSRKRYCRVDSEGNLKCFVQSIAEKGKANEEVIDLLASLLNIPQHAIEIIKGYTARIKRIKISTSLSLHDIMHKLCKE
jgi:uncharacterized protein YggU (UPF0235/DUF167 family)